MVKLLGSDGSSLEYNTSSGSSDLAIYSLPSLKLKALLVRVKD
jgi:hypothetical protein